MSNTDAVMRGDTYRRRALALAKKCARERDASVNYESTIQLLQAWGIQKQKARADDALAELAFTRAVVARLYEALFAEQLAEFGPNQYARLDEMCAQIRLAVVLANKAYDFAVDVLQERLKANPKSYDQLVAELKP